MRVWVRAHIMGMGHNITCNRGFVSLEHALRCYDVVVDVGVSPYIVQAGRTKVCVCTTYDYSGRVDGMDRSFRTLHVMTLPMALTLPAVYAIAHQTEHSVSPAASSPIGSFAWHRSPLPKLDGASSAAAPSGVAAGRPVGASLPRDARDPWEAVGPVAAGPLAARGTLATGAGAAGSGALYLRLQQWTDWW